MVTLDSATSSQNGSQSANKSGSSRDAEPASVAPPFAEVPGAIWMSVCRLDDIVPNTGVCALVGRRQVAIVRVGDPGEVYAVSNFDPFSKAFVIARGIVGDRGGVPKIASPIFKQNFDLRTGRCLDDPQNLAVSLKTLPVRVRDGRVEVQLVAQEDAPTDAATTERSAP